MSKTGTAFLSASAVIGGLAVAFVPFSPFVLALGALCAVLLGPLSRHPGAAALRPSLAAYAVLSLAVQAFYASNEIRDLPDAWLYNLFGGIVIPGAGVLVPWITWMMTRDQIRTFREMRNLRSGGPGA